MKFLMIALICALPFKWETDFEQAKKTAKESHKLILLNFSGSDWCGPCIMMRKEYLDDAQFQQMADDNLVMVNADFPRKKKNQLAPEMAERNAKLADVYNKDGHFPFTLLLDADGKVLKTWTGKPEVPVADWTAEVSTICKNKKQ